jgi:hypothetical protein
MFAEILNSIVYFGTGILYTIIQDPTKYFAHIIFSLLVFTLAVFVHEIAHGLVLNHFVNEKIPVKFNKLNIEVGSQEQIDKLTPRQFDLVLGCGVLAGLAVLIAFSSYFSNTGFLSMFLFYLLASRSDLKQIFNNVKNS